MTHPWIGDIALELAVGRWVDKSGGTVTYAEVAHLYAQAPEVFPDAIAEAKPGNLPDLCRRMTERAGRPIARADVPFGWSGVQA